MATSTTKELGHGIRVRRFEIEARDIKRKDGTVKHLPARWSEAYWWCGHELANRNSDDEIVCLNGDLLLMGAKAKGKNTYECALAGHYAEGFKGLFEILGITADTKISEFLNLRF